MDDGTKKKKKKKWITSIIRKALGFKRTNTNGH